MKHLKIILNCMICTASLTTSLAQGLSLSFNLTESDTLANMIADSKKYDISSLTLSGYVNQENTSYIKDLNERGVLKNLDLSQVSHISTFYNTVERYTFSSGDGPGATWYNKDVGKLSSFLYLMGFSKLPGGCEFTSHGGLNSSFKTYITVSKRYTDKYLYVTLTASYTCPYGDPVTGSETIAKEYSIEQPKLMFQDNSFTKLVLPNNILSIGGSDCRFRVKQCDEYTLGSQISVICENAFKDSNIGSLTKNSIITEIKTSAFENATGNILANPQFLLEAEMIGEGAFRNSTLLENDISEITLQAVKIDKCAFQNAILPPKVTLLNVKEMGQSAFMNTGVIDVVLGDELTDICDSVFANCSNLKTIIGGTNIKSIGERGFYGCIMLKTINLSTLLTSIGKEAFANTSLVNFSVPNATKAIGYKAFANSGIKKLDLGLFDSYRRDIIYGCDSLEVFSVNDNNEYLKTECGVLFSKSGSKILSYPCAMKNAIYEIGNGVTEIADSAFYGVSKLNALTIARSVNKIGINAFANSGIWEVKILPSITPKVTNNKSGLNQSLVRLFVHENDYSTYYIANYWGDFKNIYVLEKAISADYIINVEKAGTLPEYIGFGNSFKYDNLRLAGNLNSDDIRYLREMAGRDARGNQTAGILSDLDFSQASIAKGGEYYYIKNDYSSGKLTTSDNVIGESMFEGCKFKNLIVSETAKELGDKALYGCNLSSFKIPSSTNVLNPNSFFGMNTLKEIIVDEGNGIYQSIDGVLFTKDGKSLLLYPYLKEGEIYRTPETTALIGEQAFGGDFLKVLIANEGLIEIGTLAFDNLGSLEGISLPSTLEKIGHRAFWGCNKLMDITCKAYSPPTLECDYYSYFGQPYNNFSDKTYENAILIVPESNGGYKYHSGWNLFHNITQRDGLLGDVDNSGAININDVVYIINYILNKTNDTFISEAADVDGNGSININDVVTLINRFILHRNSSPRRAPAVMTENAEITDHLFIDNMSIKPGETIEIAMQLANDNEVRAVQGNIKLPEGLKFAMKRNGNLDVKNLDERSEDFTLSCALQEDGSMTFAHYSGDGFAYEGHEGGIFTFKVTAEETAEPGDYEIDLTGVVLSINGVGYEMPDLVSQVAVMNADGISLTPNPSPVGEGSIYNLAGQRLYKPQRGVNIVDGKKVVVR